VAGEEEFDFIVSALHGVLSEAGDRMQVAA
jgi:hypothetical protein